MSNSRKTWRSRRFRGRLPGTLRKINYRGIAIAVAVLAAVLLGLYYALAALRGRDITLPAPKAARTTDNRAETPPEIAVRTAAAAGIAAQDLPSLANVERAGNTSPEVGPGWSRDVAAAARRPSGISTETPARIWSPVYLATALIGLLLVIFPWVLGYSGDGLASLSTVVLGAAVIVVSLACLVFARDARWGYWITGLLGILVLIAPFAMGFEQTSGALWSCLILGALIVLFCGSEALAARPSYT